MVGCVSFWNIAGEDSHGSVSHRTMCFRTVHTISKGSQIVESLSGSRDSGGVEGKARTAAHLTYILHAKELVRAVVPQGPGIFQHLL